MLNVYVAVFVLLCMHDIAQAYSVSIPAGDSFCVVSDVVKDGQCTGSFEVISNEPKSIAVTVHGPTDGGHILHFESRFRPEANFPDAPDHVYAEGSFAIDVEDISGEYTMCIENNHDSGEIQTVAFNFRTTTQEEKDYRYAGLDTELHELHEGLDLLRDHQSYMNQKERVHQEALEGINQKVVFWTVLEAVVVILMAFWQIHYISTFFETKRKM
jgi:hypothetical protein